MLYGNIHSIETCGTVDGPGVRFVVFLQGCCMRCKYCHNPDTWEISAGSKFSTNDILDKYDGVKEFCKGGITVTGGEPLLQAGFVTELFKLAKEKGIHTAVDTSGITFTEEKIDEFDRLLKYTDLVLLDIKHIDDQEHIKLTGKSNKNILKFAKYLSDKKIPVWIRHVVVPEITFNAEYLAKLGKFLKTLKNIKALDVLPYHDMAKNKYEEMSIKYPLINIPPLTKAQALEARQIIIENMKDKLFYTATNK